MQIPWRAAPRAALSSPLTLLVSVVTALLLSFVVAAAVLHSSASGSAAIAYEQSRLCEQLLHPGMELARNVPTELVEPIITSVRQAAGPGQVLTGTYTAVQKADFGGKSTFAKFGYREGAIDHLKVLQGGSRDGLWVPLSLTRTVDGFKLGERGMGGLLPPVTAVYADLNDPLEQWWCSERQFVVPNPLDRRSDITSAVVWMPSQQSFLDLPPSILGSGVGMTVRFPTKAPVTVDQAQALLDSGTAVLDRTNVEMTRNVFALPVRNARTTIDNVRSAILPLTLISVLIGLAGIGTVTSGWVHRRRTELRVLWCRGSGPVALGGRAVLELGLPLVLGGAAGLGVSWLLMPLYAPATSTEPGAGTIAALAVVAVVVASLAVTWVVAAFRAHRVFQGRPTTNRVRRVLAALPWELATGVLAFLAWQRLQRVGLAVTPSTGALPRIDATALAFPLLVVLTTALLAARVLRLLLRASHRTSLWHRPVAQIAIRRLAATAGPVAGVLLVGVLAIGTIAVGSSVGDAQQDVLESKSGLFAGANSTVQVSTDVVTGKVELPAALHGSTTIVGYSKENDRVGLVVDPATFTDCAYLGDTDPAEIRALITEPLKIGAAPNREVTLPGLPPLNPVTHLPSFPKVGPAGYVVPRDRIKSVDGIGTWQIWSTRSAADLTRQLQDAGIDYRDVQDRSKAISGLPFLAIGWAFGFVTAIGAVLAIVAATALLLAIEVRRRQNAVAGALSTRMGMTPAALLSSHLVELGAVAAFAVVVGSAASALSAGFAVPRLDPLPRLTPTPTLPNVVPLLLATTAGSALVVLAAAWIALRTVRTARIGELIRG
ncbi:MAG: FtsX-like permease family protein [Umezawaea sp.]